MKKLNLIYWLSGRPGGVVLIRGKKMLRRTYVLGIAALFALVANGATAQQPGARRLHHDPNLRQASCAGETGVGCGGSVASGACGCGQCADSLAGNTAPCGAGGCAAGGCSTESVCAPYGFCLFQNNCNGACGGGCKTIFAEMAMDIRRWSLGRRCGGCGGGGLFGNRCCCGGGSFLGHAGLVEASCGCEAAGCAGGCTGDELFEATCGCEDAGCSGGCSGLGLGRHFQGACEATCGCESVGCEGGCLAKHFARPEIASVPLESSCGCEETGCTGDCLVELGDGCTGSNVMPCKSPSIFSGLGDLLFGSSCDCSTCTSSGEASCGVEHVAPACSATGCSGGCASTDTVRQPRGRTVSAEQPLRSKLLTTRLMPKPKRTETARRTTPRAILFAADDAHSSVEQVGFDVQIEQPVQFMNSANRSK